MCNNLGALVFSISLLLSVMATGCSPRANADEQTSAPAKTKSSPIDESIALNNRGVLTLAKKDFSNAIKDLTAALKLNPAYKLARENLAIAYNNYALSLMPDHKAALKYFHKSLYLQPGNKTTAENINALIRESLKLNPSAVQDRLKLANAALLEKDFASAIAEYGAALAIQDDTALRERLMGTPPPADLPDMKDAHTHANEHNPIYRWEEICQQRPTSAESHLGLAIELEKIGHLQRAERELRKALSLDPDNETVKERLKKYGSAKPSSPGTPTTTPPSKEAEEEPD